MFSLPKLIALAAILYALWYGLRWAARINRIARTVEQAHREQTKPAPAAVAKTQELVACPVCGTYVAPRAPSCGRADCPGTLAHAGG